MRDAAVQDEVIAATTWKADEQFGPVGSVGGDGTEQAGAGDARSGDGASQHGADQGVGEVVHGYTMSPDLASRPGRP